MRAKRIAIGKQMCVMKGTSEGLQVNWVQVTHPQFH